MSARFQGNEIYVYSSATPGNYSGIEPARSACPHLSDPASATAACLKSTADAGTDTIKCETSAGGENTWRDVSRAEYAANVISAGQNTDPTTFLHELHHAIMLMDDNMKEFRDIYMKVKDTKQFRSFLPKNVDILKYVLGKKDADGKFVRDSKGNYTLDETILDSLFKSDSKWTTADFEFEARLYEAYMRSGQTFNPTLTGFFRRVAETFRKIYTALRNGFSSVKLNDEIVEYYDKLYGYDKTTGQTSSLSGSGELSHLDDRTDNGTNEKTDTLKQEDFSNAVDLTEEFSLIKSREITADDVKNYIDGLIGQVFDTASEPLQIQITKDNKIHVVKSNVLLKGEKKVRHDSALANIENIINSAKVTDKDGTVDLTHNSKRKTLEHKSQVVRYVYFETPVRIGESNFITELATEQNKGQEENLLDLYNVKVKKIDSAATNLIASQTRANNNIASSSDSVKNILKQEQTPSEQYEAVKAQYYGTDKYMIAPNGKASNLTERQWIQTRSPNFLEWGGDWIRDPEHASVILDGNGEPKQLYHGSPSAGIEVFDNDGRSINGGENGFTYLTDNEAVAENFSREFTEGSSAYRNRPTGRTGEVYSLFAKMANPLDFRNITEEDKTSIAESFVDNFYEGDDDRTYRLESTRNSIENALKAGNYQLVKNYAEYYLNDLSAKGYDGFIAPMGTSEEMRDSLEYAVSSPNQVKSADRNNGNFSTESDSILMQEGESNPYKPESFDVEINDIFKNRGNSQYNEIVLSKASDVYKEIGLEGEEFRVKRGSITRHRTKDGHLSTAVEWIRFANNFNKPTGYFIDEEGKYHIYFNLRNESGETLMALIEERKTGPYSTSNYVVTAFYRRNYDRNVATGVIKKINQPSVQWHQLPSDLPSSADSNPIISSEYGEVKGISEQNKAGLDSLQSHSQQNIEEIATGGESLNLVGDEERIEKAKSAVSYTGEAEAALTTCLKSIADEGTDSIKCETAAEEENAGVYISKAECAANVLSAGQNRDVSDFVRALFQAVTAIRTKEANEIRKTLKNEVTRAQIGSFIMKNLGVWGEEADIERIMSSLSSIKDNSNADSWKAAQNENLAHLYEAYRRSERSIRQSLPQTVGSLFEKLTQLMNRVYGILKDTVPLVENTAKAYDTLLGPDDITAGTKRVGSKGVFKEFQEISDKTEDSILFSDNEYDAIDLTEENSLIKAVEIPAALMNGRLIEFKNMNSIAYSQFKNQLKDGLSGADVVYTMLQKEKLTDKTTETDICISVCRQTDKGSRYNGKIAVVSVRNEKPEIYEIKNGTPMKVPSFRPGGLSGPEKYCRIGRHFFQSRRAQI